MDYFETPAFRDLVRDRLRNIAEVAGDEHCGHCKEGRNRVRKIVDELEHGNMTADEAWKKYGNVRVETRCTHRWLRVLSILDLILDGREQEIFELKNDSNKERDNVLKQINVLEDNDKYKPAQQYQRLRGFVSKEHCAEMLDIDDHAEECRYLRNDIKAFVTGQSGLTKGSNIDPSIEAMLKKEHDKLMRAFFKVMSFKLPEPLKFKLSYHSDTAQVTRISSRGRKTFPALEEETLVKEPWPPIPVPVLAY